MEWGFAGSSIIAEADFQAAFDDYLEDACDTADTLASFPAPDIAALAHKIEAVERFGDWAMHGASVLADAKRLGGAM